MQIDLNNLLKKCKKGDIVSQELLYKTYKDVLFALCLKYCNNHEQAQDILQESFLIIFTTLTKYKATGSFEGWMKRIVINQAITKFKEEIKFNVLVNEETLGTVEIESSLMDEIPLDTILACVQELPSRYRLVFTMYELDDYSHADIAQMLSISEGTSKSNLHRSKLILREKLYLWKSQQKSRTYGN